MTTSGRTAIFLSYRREDSIETAGRIYSWLSMRLPERAVFLDVRSIAPGVNYRAAMDAALDEAEVVLAIIGKAWRAAPQPDGTLRLRLEEPDDAVRQEIELALARQKRIIPLLTQGATMPQRDELPASIRAFADLNAQAVRPEPDFDDDMRTVRAAIMAQQPKVAWQAAYVVPSIAPTLRYALSHLFTNAFSGLRGRGKGQR